jgi:hypothetical protein
MIIFVYYPSSVYLAWQGLSVATLNDGEFLAHKIRKR